MAGLPKNIKFLARMPLLVSAAASPSPPPFIDNLKCSGGAVPVVLEPYRLSPDSTGWYGGIETLTDPFVPAEEEYLASEVVGSQVGVEIPLPINLASDSGTIVSAKFVNATSASLGIVIQYFDLNDNSWHSIVFFSNITLTNAYFTTYVDHVLDSVSFGSEMSKLRFLVKVVTLVSSPSLVGEVRLNHLTLPYCSLSPPPSPPALLPPLIEPTQPPDDVGTLPPFFELEPFLPPLPPPPPGVLPPLPPGSEILRPNRDIFVRLWQPRPAYMQLNDPLYLNNPVDVAVPLYGPATVDQFDETTGNFIGTVRPRVEVGFTAPITEGPWDALQLRFRAARSRPPQPELPEPSLPDPGVKQPAPTECPPDQTLTPRSTDFPGIWQNPPLEAEISDSVDSPDNTCFISAPVEVPPGVPAQLAFTSSPIEWDEGWDQIKVRVVAKAQAAAQLQIDNAITGLIGIVAQFDQVHAGLPPGGPGYQVRWNPLGCNGKVHAFQFSDTERRGTGILQTNIDIHAEFFLTSQDSDNIAVQVSTDGINYYGSVVFDLGAFKSTVIYYRLALNKNGMASPVGSIAIAAGLIITGPEVITGVDVISYPRDSAPFIVSVSQKTDLTVPLVSQCRVGVSLHGNMELLQEPVQYTDFLTNAWFTYELTWGGFWSADNIKDLRIQLSAEAMLLLNDVPFINISAMDVLISPYCPGLSQPLSLPLISLSQVDVLPISDISVTGWSPVPSWSTLVSDPTLASDSGVLVDPRDNNQLLLGIAAPTGLFDVLDGYVREWIRVEVILQARIITLGSMKANLLVSTNFGQEQWTDYLTADQTLYSISWYYDQGLTTDQINRLKVAFIANPYDDQGITNGGVSEVSVSVSALKVRLTFQDVLVNPPVPLPPPPSGVVYITVVESYPEVFSCGSLGDCSAPQGRLLGKVMVTNPDSIPATVNFVTTDEIQIRISDASNNVYSHSQSIAAGVSITYFIYGWVGDSSDLFPVDPKNGRVFASLVYSGGVQRVSLGWYYIGL